MARKTIAEIKELLVDIENEGHPLLKELRRDERSGVQKLIKRWEKQRAFHDALEQQHVEMTIFEREIYQQGFKAIAGIDEVGRGPLAGPVVAACVILPRDFKLLGLTDSKKLSKTARESFYDVILKEAVDVGIGITTAREIDDMNIYQASKEAMIRAIQQIEKAEIDYLLVDAMELPIKIAAKNLIKGDARSLTIAASSVIAKVTRDRYMENLHNKYPQYAFNKHMGYGTNDHLEALQAYGIIEEVHRKSFAPVKKHL
ncbi:ribonuclease HII [Salipaludibacillus sp. LMS25]|jgi:ribonuclease HII|uniref:ribonuclease HII n=1 Tax=Salipaludibacillus sp. LMS25 TaxID=2924031 RepID=UPI0020D1E5DE|nr:ribonuclease HII [Salipaludibacillus sp. LMS25]UTR15117.1 ribonuclease HII [Salipaludibacillus sp. LMS25]